MKAPKCPHCGSTHMSRSPSGKNLLCLSCNRVVIQPRAKEAREVKARTESSPGEKGPAAERAE